MASLEEQIQAATQFYDWHAPYTIEAAAASGMNNTTRIVNCGAHKFVLRLYNNHEDMATVRLEHQVLKAITGSELGFQVPDPVVNRIGDTISVLPEGKLACLFRYIEGERPDPDNIILIKELGTATGKISLVLNDINNIDNPQYSPYYELGITYAAMDKHRFLAIADQNVAFRHLSKSFELLQREREQLLSLCNQVADLPRQWIHGDICCGNTLHLGERISGVLDFEFVTLDSRAMELAVVMVDLLRRELGDGISERLRAVHDAFQEVVPLNAEERNLLPTLMKLRLLDITLHFAVRYSEGLDGPDVLAGIVDRCAFGCEWISKHKPIY
ncbi:phosphotransferase [Paenibacillus sp. strain BS8-2]